MNNAAYDPVAKIPLSVFGGAVTEMAPSDLPEGASPLNQDVDYLPGSVFTRGGRQNIASFANLFAEDLAGVGITIADGHVPNETAWQSPNNATLNVPGTYASVTLNGAGTGGTALDVFNATGGESVGTPTASDSVTPTYPGDVILSYRMNSNTNPPVFGAPFTDTGMLNVGAIGRLGWQRVSGTSAVPDSYAVPGTQAWCMSMMGFGSSANPTFTAKTSGTTALPLTTGAFTLTAGVPVFAIVEIAGNSNFATVPFTASDSQGNLWVKIGDSIGVRIAGPQKCQVSVWYCQSPIGGPGVTATLGGNTGALVVAWTVFQATNLVPQAVSGPFSQALDLTNFNFNIPITDTITGLVVEVSGHQTVLTPDALITANLLLPNGSLSPLAITFQLPSADAQVLVGIPSQGWSVPLTPALLNNPAFGVQLVAQATGGEIANFSIYAGKLKAFFSPSPPQNFNYLKTYEQQTSGVFTLELDGAGVLWQEDATNAPGLFSSIFTSINPGSYGKSVTFQNTEYIAFSDLVQGTDMPRQWTGVNLDRISQVGPGAPPSFASTSNGSTVASIVQQSPYLLTTSANNWLLVSSGPGAHGTFGTPAQPGNVMTIVLKSTDVPPTYFKAGTNIQIAGFPSINGHAVNNDPTGVSNPAYYTITSVGAAIAGENSYDWITFQVPFTTFYNQQTPGGCQIQATTATLTMAAQVPYLEVGNQFTLTGVTPSGWNNTFTVLQTPNAAVLQIQQTSLTGNVATYVFTLISGSLPVVGQFINVNGTLNGNGIFNVINAVITSVSPTSFSLSIQSPNINAAAEANANASIYGTIFVFDPAGTATNPIIGNAGPGGSLQTTGVIGVGIRKAVLIFRTRNGALTQPSPFAQFNITGTATAIVASSIWQGPPDTVQRIIAFTGAGGGNYFWIPQPVTVTSNGQQITYSSTVINDNVTTQATFSFPDAVLLAATAIDIQGNNLFAQQELGSCRGFLTYSDRLIAWGVQNKIQNLLNLSFDGGIGVQNLQQLATQPAVPTFPLGWTVDSANGAGGQLLVSPLFGNSYYVKNSTGITKALYGMIEQPAYVNQLGTPIVVPATQYSCRVTARCPSGVQTGNIVVDFFSPVLNQIFGSFSIPLSSLTSNMKILTGALLTNVFGTVPKDLLIRIYGQNIPNGGDFEIDRIEPFPTAEPSFATQFVASYANNQEAFDGTTGYFGPSQNQQRANGGMVLFDILYMLKENSWFSTSDNGVTEPGFWNWKTVSDKVGTIGIDSYDYGEGWAITACRAGVYYFEGGEPVKISQEIQTLWDMINWQAGPSIWVVNDTAARTIKIGVPIPTPNVYMPEFPLNANPTTPNVVLSMSYRELNTGAELAHIGPIRSSFTGRLLSPEPARKWSFWNIACPAAAMIDRGNNSSTLLYGTGYHDSKIFQLSPAQLSDDGAAVNSFYVTCGLPRPESAAQMGIDVLRMQFDYMLANVTGSGTLVTMLYPEDPKNTKAVMLDQLPLDPITQGNNEIPVNWKGNRVFIRMGTNAVGSGFQLSGPLISIISEDVWAPVRGTASGTLS